MYIPFLRTDVLYRKKPSDTLVTRPNRLNLLLQKHHWVFFATKKSREATCRTSLHCKAVWIFFNLSISGDWLGIFYDLWAGNHRGFDHLSDSSWIGLIENQRLFQQTIRNCWPYFKLSAFQWIGLEPKKNFGGSVVAQPPSTTFNHRGFESYGNGSAKPWIPGKLRLIGDHNWVCSPSRSHGSKKR